jgi:hypothetical protein
MPRDLDVQLLESVAVRRGRLREALIWGRERRVRSTVDNLKRLAIGVVLAAVGSAGCVGYSFVQNMLAEREAQQQARQQQQLPAPIPIPVPEPSGSVSAVPTPTATRSR